MTKAVGRPSKAFFVRMLTRDITLDDCILDLVDNSIDSAWKQMGSRDLSLTRTERLAQHKIEIEFNDDQFRIADNCGGISLENAAKYAFTFGRLGGADSTDFSVGVYGIGMKRAIFKIGNDIAIRSTAEQEGRSESFLVPIDVHEWLVNDSFAEGSWDFDLVPSEPLPSPGVEIQIGDLSAETKAKFSDPTYGRTLRAALGRDYLLALMHGLQLVVNGEPVVAKDLALRSGENFEPLREVYSDGVVNVEMLAGMWSTPPDDDLQDESAAVDKTSGWYVFCNGRAVLDADTTSLTGWGEGLPKWHPQYNGFVGLILFSSADPLALPMTTTKRSVDVSSGVFRRARDRMIIAGRAWVDYTNLRKQSLIDAKLLEVSAPAVAIEEVPLSSMRLPLLKRTAERRANISYSRSPAAVRRLGEALGDANMTYRDVGIQSFEYCYQHLVDGDAE